MSLKNHYVGRVSSEGYSLSEIIQCYKTLQYALSKGLTIMDDSPFSEVPWLSESLDSQQIPDSQIIELLDVIEDSKPLNKQVQIEKRPVNVGEHALIFAAKNGRLDLVKYLLQKGVSADYFDQRMKTALYQSLLSNKNEHKREIVQLILERSTEIHNVFK